MDWKLLVVSSWGPKEDLSVCGLVGIAVAAVALQLGFGRVFREAISEALRLPLLLSKMSTQYSLPTLGFYSVS